MYCNEVLLLHCMTQLTMSKRMYIHEQRETYRQQKKRDDPNRLMKETAGHYVH